MDLCLFLIAMPHSTDSPPPGPEAAPAMMAALSALAPAVTGLQRFVLHTPVVGGAHDPYLKDASTPHYAMQFYFDQLGALEAALVPGGALQALCETPCFAPLGQCQLTQQVMAVRRFPVPAPQPETPGENRCTYLVSYEGQADDFNAWLGHYVDHHPSLMAQFPGIRQIEIYTRVDYRSDLPVARSLAMQRNKVVFDTPAALNLALASPVRHAMRDDFKQFPPFVGENFHFPMLSGSWHAGDLLKA